MNSANRASPYEVRIHRASVAYPDAPAGPLIKTAPLVDDKSDVPPSDPSGLVYWSDEWASFRHCDFSAIDRRSMEGQELAKEMEAKHPNLYVLNSRALEPLLTKIRDRATTHMQFKHYSDRLVRILAEEGLASCASMKTTVVTPTGDSVTGIAPAESVCAVSIIRAGCSLLHAVISCDPTIAVGKILIQRDESSEDKHAVMYYSKLPPNVATFKNVLVVDPMLGTGGSITMAIKTLLGAGVDEDRITFLNVLSCPEGLDVLFAAHPNVKVVTAGVDRGLNKAKYLTPGIGDFGDRYFNTVHSHHP